MSLQCQIIRAVAIPKPTRYSARCRRKVVGDSNALAASTVVTSYSGGVQGGWTDGVPGEVDLVEHADNDPRDTLPDHPLGDRIEDAGEAGDAEVEVGLE